jgi:hypothetical protein
VRGSLRERGYAGSTLIECFKWGPMATLCSESTCFATTTTMPGSKRNNWLMVILSSYGMASVCSKGLSPVTDDLSTLVTWAKAPAFSAGSTPYLGPSCRLANSAISFGS